MFFFFNFVTGIFQHFTENQCQAPYGTYGSCIPLNRCRTLGSFASLPTFLMSYEQRQFIRQYECGNSFFTLYVNFKWNEIFVIMYKKNTWTKKKYTFLGLLSISNSVSTTNFVISNSITTTNFVVFLADTITKL